MSERQQKRDQQWQRAGPFTLSMKRTLAWMVGRKKRGMKASPWMWESASPPYHNTSPHLVPRPLRPLWVLAYYLPTWLRAKIRGEEATR